MIRLGTRPRRRVPPALAAGCVANALMSGASLAQHAYTVGPPNEILEQLRMGPVRRDTDADRSCLGGYNSETPYATNTCLPAVAGRSFVMTRTLRTGQAAPREALTRAVDVPDAIAACWTPPPGPTREITLRVTFTSDAHPSGARVTYVAASDSRARADLRHSLLAALENCGALRFTPALGRSIAGRPFAIRFILPARS